MFSDQRGFRVALVVALLITCSCNRGQQNAVGPRRIAVLPVEDLSSSAVAWQGRAIAGLVAARTGTEVFDVPDLASAQLRRATYTLSGYLTRSENQLLVSGTLRDEITGKATAVFQEAAPDVLALSERIARAAGLNVRPYTTTRIAAVQAYYEAVVADDQTALVQAAQVDAHYGAPLVALAEIYAREGRAEELAGVMQRARSAKLTPLEAARLDFVQSQSSPDPRKRLAALARVVRLQAGDVPMQRNLVQAALSVSDYELVAEAGRSLLAIDPADEVALNTLGYAATLAGNKAEAERAFTQYREALPKSANALDSYAESLFYFGDYGRAAPLFLEAHKLDANHLGGHEPVRAALSYFLAGDRTRADQVFEEWVSQRTASGDTLASARRAVWQRWTKRVPKESDAPFDVAMRGLWALQDGERERAQQLGLGLIKNANAPPAARNLASMTLLLAQPSATADVWKQRIAAAVRNPAAARAGQQMLAWALLLDGKASEAASVLRPLVAQAAPTQSNEERILLAAALLASKQREEARKVMPAGFFPPNRLNPDLSALLFPMAYDTARALRGST